MKAIFHLHLLLPEMQRHQLHCAWYLVQSHFQSVALDKIGVSHKHALQPDESTDISGHAQLLANVCFVDEDTIRENFFCKALP